MCDIEAKELSYIFKKTFHKPTASFVLYLSERKTTALDAQKIKFRKV